MPLLERRRTATAEKSKAACTMPLIAKVPSIKHSDPKRSSFRCASSRNKIRAPSPAWMPRPTTAPLPHAHISTLPPNISSRGRPVHRARQVRRRTESQECRLVTIESEGWMEVLTKERIAFMDWEPPVTRRWSPRGESSSSRADGGNKSAGDSGKGKKMSEDGHITVQVPRRPLPGQQEGLTYIRYYRTADGKPATRE